MDREPYRYQKFISDIAGQDIFVHNNNPEEVVRIVRDWLGTASERQTIPGGSIIWRRYRGFLNDKSQVAQELHLEVEDLKYFNHYIRVVAGWLSLYPSSES